MDPRTPALLHGLDDWMPGFLMSQVGISFARELSKEKNY